MAQEDTKISISPSSLALILVIFIFTIWIIRLVTEPSGWGMVIAFGYMVFFGIPLVAGIAIYFLIRSVGRKAEAKNALLGPIAGKQTIFGNENIKKVFGTLIILAITVFLMTLGKNLIFGSF